ncbi:protein kinase C-like 1 [Dendrobates tinctorius]|uniref:protein kinase C-like 1 n=1 Tax=Dendrobates tinctorius TaxID=92724 RepID=UPI003CC92E76
MNFYKNTGPVSLLVKAAGGREGPLRANQKKPTSLNLMEQNPTYHQLHQKAKPVRRFMRTSEAADMLGESDDTKIPFDLSNFDFCKELGEGGYGKVILVSDQVSKELLAVKIMEKSKCKEEKVFTELGILQMATECRYLMSLRAFTKTPEEYLIAMEYMAGGDLFDHMRHWMPFNIQTTRLFAAEMVMNGQGYNQLADSFSFGVILYKMTVGDQPFYSRGSLEEYRQSLEEDALYFPPGISFDAIDIIAGLLCKNPCFRYAITSYFRTHPFFSSISWSDVDSGRSDPPFRWTIYSASLGADKNLCVFDAFLCRFS